jgi:formate hydrogenlyase subunit 3/multisubunit Na+/H+ antiporter MnhD subunit
MLFLTPGEKPASDPSLRMLLPLGILAVCLVLFGIWPDPLRSLLQAASALY